MAFLINTENKETVNHIDGNKKNNKLSNLEWNTHAENTSHAWKTGLIKKKKGDSCNNRKLSSLDVMNIKEMLKENTHKEIAGIYNVSKSTISAISCGKNWK